jgi:cellobiose epimerase
MKKKIKTYNFAAGIPACFYLMFLMPLVVVFAPGCMNKSSIPHEGRELAISLRDPVVMDLRENLLPFWGKYSVDHTDPNEGFYGGIENDGTGVRDAKRHIVLFTRYLWTWSAAYRVLGDNEYLELADRAYAYLSSHFIDRRHGGLFMELNADGTVSSDRKMVYGLSFAIYAFSEYYRATGNRESLHHAIDVFELLEQHALDTRHGGYLEMFSADWQYLAGEGVVAQGRAKSMNTHLHLLEAYTNLYRVWPDERLRSQLIHLVEIFDNHILNRATYHLELFFAADWTVSGRYDSYGHDIEFSWLLVEAAHVLDDPDIIERAEETAVKVARAQFEEGMNSDGAMIYEKAGDTFRRNISWWVQAEAVVGFLNAWEISGCMEFLEAAYGVWRYIDEKMIDRRHGGWFPDLDEHGNPRPGRRKGDAWTCPYHNARMGLEVFERLHNI